MKLKTLIVLSLAVLIVVPVYSQGSLQQLAEENGVEWVAGDWSGQTDDGDRIRVSFEWTLSGNALDGHVRVGGWEGRSMTALDPDAEVAQYFGTDNRGALARGQWDTEDDKAILKYEYNNADESGKVGIVYEQSGDEKMKVSIHSIDGAGDLVKPARSSVTLDKEE